MVLRGAVPDAAEPFVLDGGDLVGFSVNAPVKNFALDNTAETIFNRLDDHRKTWKIYVAEPQRLSGTALAHFQRLKDHAATNIVPFSEFESDAANGTLPDFAFIEPCLTLGHADYHPACGRAMGHGIVIPSFDPPSSILGGEAFLSRIYDVYKNMQSPTGANVWNTTLLIGWDEPGGTYDHVPPPAYRRPIPRRRPASTDSRSTVPAIGSPPSSCRRGWRKARCSTRSTATPHSSPTLREQWKLGTH
ncbi:hypothetical protein FXW78_34175 [Rhodococcus opacus]|nr:hypothetical protein [Rhodococcus opacus]